MISDSTSQLIYGSEFETTNNYGNFGLRGNGIFFLHFCQHFTSINIIIVEGAIVGVVGVAAAVVVGGGDDIGGLTRGAIIRSHGVRVPILLLLLIVVLLLLLLVPYITTYICTRHREIGIYTRAADKKIYIVWIVDSRL